MDEVSEGDNAFAIPDLWKTPSLADFDKEPTTDQIALRLEPLGML